MIRTILRVSWISLRRDRLAMVLTFLMPIGFFSVFAWVFGSLDRAVPNPARVALVCEDAGECESSLRPRLEDHPSIRLHESAGLDAAGARELVGRGRVDVAVIVPAGFSESARSLPRSSPRLHLLADTSNPMAVSVVQGILMTELGELLLARMEQAAAPPGGLLTFGVEDVLGSGDKRPSVAFFAAGIGVMFLLFAVSGRSAILIGERESGLLGRILATNVGLSRYLVGRWLFLSLLGAAQVGLMFLWAWAVFRLDLWSGSRAAGFALMTAVTAAAAAAFGLMLSTSCRTRAQLNGVAVVTVLTMSALGGSMFPRFLMPQELQRLGLLTFNAWALDGYRKVFWYETPLLSLWPQLAVLVGLTLLFLAVSRWSAARSLAT